jgi:hypothetical protein
VTQPAPRVVHDGNSSIVVPNASLAKRFEALWNSLVPAGGPAATLQGEVVRIAGRINDELLRNGGINWDANYRLMAQAFARHVASGKAVTARELTAVDKYVASVASKRPSQDDARVLCQTAVAWVLLNPKPIKRSKVGYAR